MILSFMQKLPWGAPSHFEEMIKREMKIHTIRMGNRWKPGHKIHFYSGNPRNGGTRIKVPHKAASYWHYHESLTDRHIEEMKMSCQGLDQRVAVPAVAATEDIVLRLNRSSTLEVEIAGTPITGRDMLALASCDGLELEDFKRYFAWRLNSGDEVRGQIIHWKEGSLHVPDKAQVYQPKK